MSNPWATVPAEAPYWLADDSPEIVRFNARVGADLKIHSELLPEPFVGNPTAPVVILASNPGFGPDDPEFTADARVRVAHRKNLLHQEQDYPFYFLDPNLPQISGCVWWRNRLNGLICKYGEVKLSQHLFCVEYFPYHSKYFKGGIRVPSQQYGFDLVRRAIKRNAIVIIMRKAGFWRKMVDELNHHERCWELGSPQNVAVTERNCPQGYKEIVRMLDQLRS